MNGNRKIFCLALGFALALTPSLLRAESGKTMGTDPQGRLIVTERQEGVKDAPEKPKPELGHLAPTLYGLREILVQYPVFLDPRASSDCSLSRETLFTVMQRNLQDPNLEIMALDETHERQGARANLIYEIHTSKLDQTCFSWINMSFTDRAAIALPPLKVPKALTVMYWQKSSLARSPNDRHQTAVGDAIAAMGRQFLREVKLAEPATYDSDQKKTDASEEELKAEKQMEMLRSINESVSKRLIDSGAGSADIPALGGRRPVTDNPEER